MGPRERAGGPGPGSRPSPLPQPPHNVSRTFAHRPTPPTQRRPAGCRQVPAGAGKREHAKREHAMRTGALRGGAAPAQQSQASSEGKAAAGWGGASIAREENEPPDAHEHGAAVDTHGDRGARGQGEHDAAGRGGAGPSLHSQPCAARPQLFLPSDCVRRRRRALLRRAERRRQRRGAGHNRRRRRRGRLLRLAPALAQGQLLLQLLRRGDHVQQPARHTVRAVTAEERQAARHDRLRRRLPDLPPPLAHAAPQDLRRLPRAHVAPLVTAEPGGEGARASTAARRGT
eukprot:gene599-biopygen21165